MRRGVPTSFVATGQTGMFIEGWGIAVDAVVADFIAGAAERLVLQAALDEIGHLLLVFHDENAHGRKPRLEPVATWPRLPLPSSSFVRSGV